MRLVLQPVIFGFVNGLAIIIGVAKSRSSRPMKATGWPAPTWPSSGPRPRRHGHHRLLPRLTKAVPGGLTAILVIFGIVTAFGIDTKTVGDLASIQGGFPVPHSRSPLHPGYPAPHRALRGHRGGRRPRREPAHAQHHRRDHPDPRAGQPRMRRPRRGQRPQRPVQRHGCCAMIGQSLINVSSGRPGPPQRHCGLRHAARLHPLRGAAHREAPDGRLDRPQIMVAIGTFEWASLRTFRRMPTSDVLIMVLVTGVTAVLHNLALAVLIGVIVAALVFAWTTPSASGRGAHQRARLEGLRALRPLFSGPPPCLPRNSTCKATRIMWCSILPNHACRT